METVVPYNGLMLHLNPGQSPKQRPTLWFEQGTLKKVYRRRRTVIDDDTEGVVVLFGEEIYDMVTGKKLPTPGIKDFPATNQENSEYFYNIPAPEGMGRKMAGMTLNGLATALLIPEDDDLNQVVIYNPIDGKVYPPIYATATVEPSLPGQATGKITVTVKDGVPGPEGFGFTLQNSADKVMQTSNVFENLPAGTWIVKVSSSASHPYFVKVVIPEVEG